MIRLILQEATAVARAIGSFNGVLDAAVAKGSEKQTAMMKGSDKSPGGNKQKRQSERKKRQSERKKKKSTSNSSSKSKNKKRKSSSSSRSKKRKSRSYRSRGYGMCGRNMRSRDKRACDRLEREFCSSRKVRVVWYCFIA